MHENRMSGLGKGCGSGERDRNAQRDPGGFREEVLGGPEGFSYLWGWAEVRTFTLWHGAQRKRWERKVYRGSSGGVGGCWQQIGNGFGDPQGPG